ANAYTGETTVSDGTLRLAAGNRLADGSTLVVSGGTFDLGGFSDLVAAVTQTGGLIANGVLFSATPFDLQGGAITAGLGGDVGFVKSGPGTVTLTGPNAYTGTTTVTGGTLALGA